MRAQILIDAILILLLFLFCWKVIGRPLINWLAPVRDVREPDVADPTNAAQLRALKAKLIEKQTLLKNKHEIAQVQKQLAEVNDKLANLAV